MALKMASAVSYYTASTATHSSAVVLDDALQQAAYELSDSWRNPYDTANAQLAIAQNAHR